MEFVRATLFSEMVRRVADHLTNALSSLKKQFERELHDPGRIGLRDESKRSTVDVAIRSDELCMVESVEEFRPELQIHSFFNERVLQQCHIPIV